MDIDTLKGDLKIVDVDHQQSLIIHFNEYHIIQLWHNGIRQLMHAIKKRETGIVTTCDHLPEVFVTHELSTVDIRRHRFCLSKTSDGDLRVKYDVADSDIVLSAQGEKYLIRLFDEISLKVKTRDRDPALDDIWYNW